MVCKYMIHPAFLTYAPASGGMVRISFYFDDLHVLNMNQNPAFRMASLANGSNYFIHYWPLLLLFAHYLLTLFILSIYHLPAFVGIPFVSANSVGVRIVRTKSLKTFNHAFERF